MLACNVWANMDADDISWFDESKGGYVMILEAWSQDSWGLILLQSSCKWFKVQKREIVSGTTVEQGYNNVNVSWTISSIPTWFRIDHIENNFWNYLDKWRFCIIFLKGVSIYWV